MVDFDHCESHASISLVIYILWLSKSMHGFYLFLEMDPDDITVSATFYHQVQFINYLNYSSQTLFQVETSGMFGYNFINLLL